MSVKKRYVPFKNSYFKKLKLFFQYKKVYYWLDTLLGEGSKCKGFFSLGSKIGSMKLVHLNIVWNLKFNVIEGKLNCY